MKRFLLLLVFFGATLPALASHIVGGEIELIHRNGFTYTINLIYYFDRTNNPGRDPADENFIRLGIFSRSSNSLIRTVTLFISSQTNVEYTQIECSSAGIATTRVLYTADIEMMPDQFGDQGGYYISWERCCRNYNDVGLLNIISKRVTDGDINFPGAAGQTFYLEFPAVVKNGIQFINSSPKLFPPLSDYACINKPYYADFAGTDDDNDSLVYSIVTPLSTLNSEAAPAPRPGPYPFVDWQNPFSIDNVMAGNPDLDISLDGLLTVTPTMPGLFVFGVLCEEFRDGVKIGEVRRDFQMMVLDCPVAVPPVIVGKTLSDTEFTFRDNMTVTFDATATDGTRCIEVRVSDKDIHNTSDGTMEKIKIRAIPLGFKKNVSSVLPSITSGVLNETDSIKVFRICFPECPFVEGPYTIGIIAQDDACALPLLDTIRVVVNVAIPPNDNATFATADVNDAMDEGDPIKKWPIEAVDINGDQMAISVLNTDGLDLASVGMNLTVSPQVGNTIKGELSWDPRCNVYDFSTRTEFEIKLLVEDMDKCLFNHPDTMKLKLKINLPDNKTPIIDTDLTPAPSERRITNLRKKVNETLTFNVTGDDEDDDFLVLGVRGIGFSLANYSISFPGVTGDGNVTSQFSWNIQCDKVNLNSRDVFEFEFIVVDNNNRCGIYQADTVNVRVKVDPPDNEKPILSLTSLIPAVQLSADNEVAITLGQKISVDVLGTDADLLPQKDNITLELLSASGNVEPSGYSFDQKSGSGSVESVFNWEPDCSIFEGGIYENDYAFQFKISDNKCFNAKSDTVELHINIKDVDGSDDEFLPANFITPNGDGCNDYFAMDGLEDAANTCGAVNIPNLPKDNCTGRFLGIRIYNRWGKQVYLSDNRLFRWYANGESSGVYYYYITYTGKEYKGTINVR